MFVWHVCWPSIHLHTHNNLSLSLPASLCDPNPLSLSLSLSLSLPLSLRFFLHSSIVLFSPLKATNHLIIMYYLAKRESPWRKNTVRSCDIMLDYERSAHGKKAHKRTDQNRWLCPAPLMIAHDQACYYMIEQSSSLMTKIVPFFFAQSRCLALFSNMFAKLTSRFSLTYDFSKLGPDWNPSLLVSAFTWN